MQNMWPQLARCGSSHVREHTEHGVATAAGTEAELPIVVVCFNNARLYLNKI